MNEPTILFKNNSVVVVDKPSGLIVHSDGKTEEPTLAEWFIKHFPEAEGVGEPLTLSDGRVIERPGIVHRLDRDTSGAIILTRTQEAFLDIKEQFKKRKVEKVYHTYVFSWFKEEDIEGIIDNPIGRSGKDFRRRSARKGAKGKLRSALTKYRVIRQGRDRKSNEPAAFLEVRPKTGRTHQIRAHLTAINHQIVCDPLYAEARPCILGFNRLALHASEITFSVDKEKVNVEAPLPTDFKEAESQLIIA
ncbi:MAG: RluA family pseudouridine synthase [Candidatus Paceibacterota bacterium]